MGDQKPKKARRRKKPLFTEGSKEFEEQLLSKLVPEIAACGAAFVAVGIDMAAQEGKWGVSVIAVQRDLNSASLHLVLPHRFSVDGFTKKHPIKPSSHFLSTLLKGF